jgi:hypothetical protein
VRLLSPSRKHRIRELLVICEAIKNFCYMLEALDDIMDFMHGSMKYEE